MANHVIQIGNKIEMRIVSNRTAETEEQEPEVYISQFLQWTDDNIASVAVPMTKGHLVPLRSDEVYELRFFTGSGLYRCKGKVIRRNKISDNIE